MSEQQRKRKVLILDDDPDVLEYASVVFQDCGFDLLICRPYDDLDAALAQHPDLIVVDLLMPGRDGIQVLHRLSKVEIRCPMLIVSMCGPAVLRSAQSVAKLLGFEVIGFLRKPFYKDDVMKLTDSLRKHEKGSVELKRLMDSGRIINHYQPIIDSQLNRVIRMEALARFHHPVSGVIPPGELFRWARRLQATEKIEETLLTGAIHDAMRMEEQGHRLPMSFNLSAETLGAPDFPDRLEKLCRENRFLLSQLTIEISEVEAHRHLVPVLSSLTRLSIRGCSVALEYGGAIFTKPQIENFPLNELKLTPALVQGSIEDQDRRNVLSAVVEHATRLEIPVTAVGVESMEQLGLLLDLGVTRFQGYLFSEDRQFDSAMYYLSRAPEKLAELGMGPVEQSRVSNGY